MDMIFINPHKCCTFVTEKSCLTSNANLCIIQKLKLLPSHYLYWGETLVNRSFLAIRHILAEFSQKTATVNQSEVDEYTITCSRAFEQNTVCVIFSPNVFAKMGLENSDSYMSNQVSLKDFRKWLIKSCTKDLEMQKKNITLKIKK